MGDRFQIGDLDVEVIRKDIKNVHLGVLPPSGRVRVSAPPHVKTETLRIHVLSRLQWIRKRREKMRAQARETPRDYVERESHYLWGKRYLLSLVEKEAAPKVEMTHRKMLLQIRPGTPPAKRAGILMTWYRDRLREALPPLVSRWEQVLGVKVKRISIRHMKTKWGSCHAWNQHILLNTELAKKPEYLLEYVLVHEMLHLLEPTHNERFLALLQRHYPSWREARAALNELPLAAETWKA